jgi:hypothetical protein
VKTCSIYLLLIAVCIALMSGAAAHRWLAGQFALAGVITLVVAILRDTARPRRTGRTSAVTNRVIRRKAAPTVQARVAAPARPPRPVAPPATATWPTAHASGDLLANRYCIVAKIAERRGYVVYRGIDLVCDIQVALKQVRPTPDAAQFTRFLQHEAGVLAELVPGVAPQYHTEFYDGAAYTLVSDWLDASTLAERIARADYEIEEAFDIAIALCRVVELLHGGTPGRVHGDLAPSNIIVCDPRRVKLIDFGLSTPIGSLPAHAERAGTPPYTAPEQWAHQVLDERADVFALGIVIQEIFAVCGTPIGVEEAVDRATAIGPHDRTRTVRALRAELHAARLNWR